MFADRDGHDSVFQAAVTGEIQIEIMEHLPLFQTTPATVQSVKVKM